MKINCPQCHTAYEVNLASLGAKGRSVRCARCQTVWFATPQSPSEPDLQPSHAAQDAPLAGVDRTSATPPQAPGAAPRMLPAGFRMVPAGGVGAEAVAVQDTETAEPAPVPDTAAPAPTGEAPDQEASAADADPAPASEAGAAAAALPEAAEAVANPPSIVPSPEGVIPAAERAFDTPSPEPAPEAQPEPAPEPAPEPEPEAPPADVESIAARRLRTRAAERKAKQARRQWHLSRLTAAILALAMIDASLLAWRNDIVRMLPQTASLYAAIGFPVNLRHLVFDAIHTGQERHDGVSILVVEGVIRATGADVVDVPRLRFAIQAANGHEVYAWTALPTRTKLARGETLAFRTRLASPPEQGRKVRVRFFGRRDLVAGLR